MSTLKVHHLSCFWLLAQLSWKLKRAFLITFVRCLSVRRLFFYTLPTSTPEPLDRIQPNLHKTSLGNAVRVCENDWPRPLVLKICLYFSKFFSKKQNHLVRKAKTFAEASLDTSSVDSSLSKSHFLGRRGGVGLLKYSAKSQLTIQESFRSIESNFE